MKRKIKYIFITIIVIVLITIGSLWIINYLNDESKLTVEENRWINTNLSSIQNVNVLNDIEVFGNNGHGILFDFIDDFSKEYDIKINPVTYNTLEKDVDDGFILTNSIDDNSVVFYEDHYALVGKNYELVKNINDIKDKKIGVLDSDYGYISNYLPGIELLKYNNIEALNTAFESSEEINYIIVPRAIYNGYVIKKNYYYIYHFSDIKSYLTYQMDNNSEFSGILKKYFYTWKKEKFNKSLNTNMLQSFVDNLDLTEKDIKSLTSKVYNYGFINNSPYEVLIGGNYGGIVSEYLKGFSNFTGVEFKFTKYRNYKMFNDALNAGNIDIYFNYYNIVNNFTNINTGMDVKYYIITNESNSLVVNSLNSLKYKTVYVLEDSILYDYISKIDGVTVKTYRGVSELKKIIRNSNTIIMIDKESYEYMANKELDAYNVRYQGITDNTYNFKVRTDDVFMQLFSKYVMIQDNQEIRVNGLYNYNKTIKSGSILALLAKYILYIIAATTIIIYLLYRKSKKLRISKKIKKEDKIKFIDQLTSLKNRNYLNENIEGWNKNTIYPQTTIVIDLDRVQEINDTQGYEQGDKQIKAAANILIRTQLDNSDIMRTDGNEFLIYLVGYDERHITSYIRKLNKEFKSLPYNYGAQIGFSMIKDDLKTIEDSINESVEDVKNKKQEL